MSPIPIDYQANLDSRVVCVWEGTVLEEHESIDFCAWIRKETGLTHDPVVIGCVFTLPTAHGPGGRCDALFAVHASDLEQFAVKRLQFNFRWFADVIANEPTLYPQKVIDAFA